MRRLLAACLAALVLCASAPSAEAAINKPRPFDADFGYMAGLDDAGPMTIVSGQTDVAVRAPGGTTSYGFFESAGFTVSGLEKVCWEGSNQCPASPGRALSLMVEPAVRDATGTLLGGSAALCLPSPSTGRLTAGHTLGLFVDLAQDDDLNSFPVDKSFLAPAVGGAFSFTSLNPIGTPGGILADACRTQGGLTTLDEATTVHVRNGGQAVATLSGKQARFAFTGQPTVTDVDAGFYVLPFNGGSAAEFAPASSKDARIGLELGRVQDLIRKLDQSHASTTVEREEQPEGGNHSQEFLAGLLNGAILRLPAQPADGEDIPLSGSHFVRFSRLEVAGTEGALDWDGRAYLEVEDGKVGGARPLLGVWLFQLPWWSYLLWAIAIGLAITRLMLAPDKNHPRWDRLRWVGWVATGVAWILVFFLWDVEVHNVLGASLLRDSSGQFKLVIGLLQVGLLSIVAFAAAAPLRVIGRNAFLLAHQGTFMGLSGGIAAILGFLFGAPYLRAYLGLILGQVMERLA